MKKNVLYFAVTFAMLVNFAGCADDSFEDTIPNSLDLILEKDIMNEDVGQGQKIPGQYIVVYNTDFGRSMNIQVSKDAVLNLTKELLGATIKSVAELKIKNIYASTINGVTIALNKNQVLALKKDNRVKFIEQDQLVQFAPPCGTPNGGPCDGGGAAMAVETQPRKLLGVSVVLMEALPIPEIMSLGF